MLVDFTAPASQDSWLSGVSYGSHTLYVAWINSDVLTTDSHAFTYQSGSAGNQSGDSGTQSRTLFTFYSPLLNFPQI